MSQSSTHALSTRLFIQAALTGLLAPTAARGSLWLVLTLAVAAGAVAVALLLRSGPANAKLMVIGFEGVALVVGGLGLAGGHYIPGTIIGVITLITALNMPAGAAVATSPDGQWVPPQTDGQPPGPYGPPETAVAPTNAVITDNPYAPPMAIAAPRMDNPYAPPMPTPPAAPAMHALTPVEAPVPPQPLAPVEANVPPQASAPVELNIPPQAPAPVEASVPPPPVPVEAPVALPVRPEDIPPAPRAMTILPGR